MKDKLNRRYFPSLGMLCKDPECNGKTRVAESNADGTIVYRKRICKKCSKWFITTEMEHKERNAK